MVHVPSGLQQAWQAWLRGGWGSSLRAPDRLVPEGLLVARPSWESETNSSPKNGVERHT